MDFLLMFMTIFVGLFIIPVSLLFLFLFIFRNEDRDDLSYHTGQEKPSIPEYTWPTYNWWTSSSEGYDTPISKYTRKERRNIKSKFYRGSRGFYSGGF